MTISFDPVVGEFNEVRMNRAAQNRQVIEEALGVGKIAFDPLSPHSFLMVLQDGAADRFSVYESLVEQVEGIGKIYVTRKYAAREE